MAAASCLAFAAARDSRSRLLREHRRPKRFACPSFHFRSLRPEMGRVLDDEALQKREAVLQWFVDCNASVHQHRI